MDASTPEGMGTAAGEIYKGALDALVKALESKPEPADAKAKATAIIDGAKTSLVELGKKREALAPADKATFDKAAAAGISSVSSKTFDAYSAIASHYRTADREVGNLIGEANTLTQYANFDLLKKQAPKEAEKYGVK